MGVHYHNLKCKPIQCCSGWAAGLQFLHPSATSRTLTVLLSIGLYGFPTSILAFCVSFNHCIVPKSLVTSGTRGLCCCKFTYVQISLDTESGVQLPDIVPDKQPEWQQIASPLVINSPAGTSSVSGYIQRTFTKISRKTYSQKTAISDQDLKSSTPKYKSLNSHTSYC